MRVLLDTNVLIAPFIARGTCHELLEHVVRYHDLVVSKFILDEFSEKLTEKFGFSKADAREARARVVYRAILVKPEMPDILPEIDPDDLPVSGTAFAGECDCLVTGDKELLQLGFFEDIPVLSPSDFWRWESEGQT